MAQVRANMGNQTVDLVMETGIASGSAGLNRFAVFRGCFVETMVQWKKEVKLGRTKAPKKVIAPQKGIEVSQDGFFWHANIVSSSSYHHIHDLGSIQNWTNKPFFSRGWWPGDNLAFPLKSPAPATSFTKQAHHPPRHAIWCQLQRCEVPPCAGGWWAVAWWQCYWPPGGVKGDLEGVR